MSVMAILLFWAFLSSGFRTDGATDYLVYYEPVARNILNGLGFVRLDGAFAINNPPGYPILLAGVFALARFLGLPENLVNLAFILLCMGLSSVFVFLLSEKIWGTRGGWFSALFFMSYPFLLWLTKQPSSEVPFMAAFYASLYLFWLGVKGQKNTWLLLLLAGMLAGVSMLIRGIAIGIGFLLFGLFLVLRKDTSFKARLLLAIALLLGNFFVILPWQVWVYEQTGLVVSLGTNGVTSIKDGLTFAVESKNYRQKIAVPADVADLQNELVSENASMDSLGEILRTVGKHFVKEPMPVMKLFMIKAGRSWYGTDSGSMEPAILVIQLFYGVFSLLAILAIWRAHDVQTAGLLLFVSGFVLYFWLMTILVLSILRYMVPTIGLFAFLIPQLANSVSNRLSSRHSQ